MPAFMDTPGLYGFNLTGYSGPRVTGATALRLAQRQQQAQQVGAALGAGPLEQYKNQLEQMRASQASLSNQIAAADAAAAQNRRRQLVESLRGPTQFGAQYPTDFLLNYARQMQYQDAEERARMLQAALTGGQIEQAVATPRFQGGTPQTVDQFAKILGEGYGNDIDPLALSIRQREAWQQAIPIGAAIRKAKGIGF